MGQAYIVRRGGNGVRFHLIAAPTVDNLPIFAQKNTLAIISDIPVGHLYVQGLKPENPNIGDVYTDGSKNTAFTIKSGAMDANIGIEYVEQYDGEKWIRVEGYAWIDNAWTQVCYARLYLYNRGDQKLETTGGWKTDIHTGITGEFGVNEFIITVIGTGDRYGTIYTKNKINLTEYKTLNMIVSSAVGVDSSGNIYLGATSKVYNGGQGQELFDSFIAGKKINVAPNNSAAITSETIISVDISYLTSSYQIQLGAAIASMTLKEVYLE